VEPPFDPLEHRFRPRRDGDVPAVLGPHPAAQVGDSEPRVGGPEVGRQDHAGAPGEVGAGRAVALGDGFPELVPPEVPRLLVVPAAAVTKENVAEYEQYAFN